MILQFLLEWAARVLELAGKLDRRLFSARRGNRL
jgi:hypothetical protein